VRKLIPYGAIALVAVFAMSLAKVPPAQMPQAVSGGGFLSVLLGDAKKDISGAMIKEADSYFHGGVDMDCHHLHGHADHGSQHDEHGHDCRCEHCAHEHMKCDGAHDKGSFDPWRWINERVRAPEIERHLEGERTIELMPWFWAAVKADPHNVEAWGTAWYVASHMMHDDALALRIAVDGWRQNAGSMAMACVVGRAYRAKGTLDQKHSEAMFRKAVELGRNKEKLEGNDLFSFYEALGYLAEYAENENDMRALEMLLREAKRVEPDHPTTKLIESKLRESRK